jgi:hypothetical protein
MTSADVANLLGVDQRTVQRIPQAELPYRESPGGPVRGGRRKYRRADVERYRDTPRDERSNAARIAALERRVSDIEQRLHRGSDDAR